MTQGENPAICLGDREDWCRSDPMAKFAVGSIRHPWGFVWACLPGGNAGNLGTKKPAFVQRGLSGIWLYWPSELQVDRVTYGSNSRCNVALAFADHLRNFALRHPFP